MDSSFGVDIELSYSALSSLEDVIAILRSVSALFFVSMSLTQFYFLGFCLDTLLYSLYKNRK